MWVQIKTEKKSKKKKEEKGKRESSLLISGKGKIKDLKKTNIWIILTIHSKDNAKELTIQHISLNQI